MRNNQKRKQTTIKSRQGAVARIQETEEWELAAMEGFGAKSNTYASKELEKQRANNANVFSIMRQEKCAKMQTFAAQNGEWQEWFRAGGWRGSWTRIWTQQPAHTLCVNAVPLRLWLWLCSQMATAFPSHPFPLRVCVLSARALCACVLVCAGFQNESHMPTHNSACCYRCFCFSFSCMLLARQKLFHLAFQVAWHLNEVITKVAARRSRRKSRSQQLYV